MVGRYTHTVQSLYLPTTSGNDINRTKDEYAVLKYWKLIKINHRHTAEVTCILASLKKDEKKKQKTKKNKTLLHFE